MGVLILVGLFILAFFLYSGQEKPSTQTKGGGKVSSIIQFLIFGIISIGLSIFTIISGGAANIIFGIIGILVGAFLLYMAFFSYKEK